MPCCLAHLMISTVPAVEAWQMCTRAPASRASSASRATIDSSAARGQPARPSSAALGPSCATAPAVSRGSSACWAISTPIPLAYSSARRITSGSCHADTVVGEQLDLRQTGCHQAHLGELLALQAHRDRTDRVHVDQPDLLAATPHVVGDHRAVGHRVGVGHREHRGEPAESRCRRAGFDVLGVLAARLAQVGVQVDEARQQHLAGRVDHVGIRRGLPASARSRRSGRRRRGRRPARLRRRVGLP